MPYPRSHSLDSVAEMMATEDSATISNVVGTIGTGVQNAAMKVVQPTSYSSSESESPIPSRSVDQLAR